MQSKLEDVLREKEGDLKLYQRFLNLRSYCQEKIFPSTDIPVERHIEVLKNLIEQLIPEPLSRTQEMFSGEIFVMLCLLYLHDIGVATCYDWRANGDILERLEKSTKTLIINRDMAARLDIPESAVEIVNSLIFYPKVKKIPTEWEIKEGSRRAIIRNTRALEHVFSFAHLLWDIFFSDSTVLSLRRFDEPGLKVQCGVSSVSADSREGLLLVKCSPKFPYQMHLLNMVKGYVESAFKKFREAVNGKLGFQYKSIVWDTDDIAVEVMDTLHRGEPPAFYSIRDRGERWEEAALVLDVLFRNGYVVVTGCAGCGKTRLMERFLLPQLHHMSMNVFQSEVWERPVGELREAVAAATEGKQSSSDMVSICNKLRQGGPCFFVLDCCERVQNIAEVEKEKLKRFVDFCLKSEDLYLIVVGDKEDFFDWYQPFSGINLSAIFELQPIDGKSLAPLLASDPESEELLKETIDEVLKKCGNKSELREVVAALVGSAPQTIARSTVAEIRAETGLPLARIVDYLTELKAKGIIGDHRSFDSTYYTLKSRHLIEPLREYLKLSEFDERRRIRTSIAKAREEGDWLPSEILDILDRWAGKLVFAGEDLSFVLASAIHHGRSAEDVLGKLEKDVRPNLAIPSDPIVGLLKEQDVEKRKEAVRLLSHIRDDQMVNELLLHLKKDEDYTIRGLILEKLVGMGKKKTLVALVRTLSDVEDRQWKLQAIELLAGCDPSTAWDALLILAETEKDSEVLDAIERAFSKLEESS